MIQFIPLEDQITLIEEMSIMATTIVKDFFDPIIGASQNDYMIQKFQTVAAIRNQLASGYRYFFVKNNGLNIGFLAFYPKHDYMYLSKFYLFKDYRGKGFAREMMNFVISKTKEEQLNRIELNVNKHNPACKVYEHLGFRIARLEKNDIGNGFYMDDYVYEYKIEV